MSINNTSINDMTYEELRARRDEIIKNCIEDTDKGVVNPKKKEIDEEFVAVSDRIRDLSSKMIAQEYAEISTREMEKCKENCQRLEAVAHRLNAAQSRREAAQHLSYYINYNDFQILLDSIKDALTRARVQLVAVAFFCISMPKMITQYTQDSIDESNIWQVAATCTFVAIAVIGTAGVALVMIA